MFALEIITKKREIFKFFFSTKNSFNHIVGIII